MNPSDDDRDDNGLPKGLRMTGPVQNNYPPYPPHPVNGFMWKVAAAVSASIVTMVMGFFAGAIWSHNTRIATLEAYRANDKENHDKLEERVNSLQSRGSRNER